MTTTILLGCTAVMLMSLYGVHSMHCNPSEPSIKIPFPKYPLTYDEMIKALFKNGENVSVPYYEIYSFDFPDTSLPLQLPILRKVAIRWFKYEDGNGARFTNHFNGWFPKSDPGFCEAGVIDFHHTMSRPRDTWLLDFDVEYPSLIPHVGTSFSSCPERYLINWYCPVDEIESFGKKTYCRYNTRMSIYSTTGADNVPWHLVTQDICKNGTPKMDDYRWKMTHDAPEQCTVDATKRKKRSSDGHPRYYL